ncbi:lasso RiPP family leader peptide-containing protein [Asticcacaulis machinosus]|uniref:Lasso RiPP family leader peptide-containing protein n=1 Tax=Asticcacaulis machinosus TaxID=2984211 RepID=A0ABT5HJN1_9CAUL|nr:lasso RiPP family leader peptide-containing protein [Asticcacaulis machinosus]MDC7676454.1 lasso RiPP family leader peptide-containing protein [Asticcacaulis machinosus]
MTQVKAAYEAPTVAKVGDFETTTQNTGTGGTLDATFPIGTPFADLTFS